MVKPAIQRFDVWLVQLDPARGSEIKKTRPGIIISPDEMSPLKTAIIAPMTSKGFSYPSRVPCTFQGKKGLVLLDQMRPVDKTRLVQKLGSIPKRTQLNITNCLLELFAY